MDNGDDLFFRLIRKLDAGGVLQRIVLIGSWALPVYRCYFDDDPEIPLLRTTDVDFLIGKPPRITSTFDVHGALSELGFEPEWAAYGGYCKYVHIDMEVEFLIPEQGAGENHAVAVDQLNVVAQPLRYLTLAYDRSMVVLFRGFRIRVPEPEAFVLLKLLVLPRRKDNAKTAKDAQTAKALGEFLINRPERRVILADLFAELPKGWQKTIRKVAGEHVPILSDLLS